jgi:DNA-binding NtrC family response regulator
MLLVQSEAEKVEKLNFETIRLEDLTRKAAASFAEKPRSVVLVADDEEVVADTLVAILQRAGFRALAAYDAYSALEIAKSVSLDLLLSDVAMNGIELAVAIEAIRPDCKILLFSAQAPLTDLLAESHKRGRDFPLLAKPLHPAVLLAHITEILASRTMGNVIEIS